MKTKWGTVYLVGFGPGDPELMTVKAERILRQADVIYFDDLINRSHLRKYSAPKIYVGKRGNKPGLPQAEINELLFQVARKHRRVVRLKGGDPFVFGRGGEEMTFLHSKGVTVEIVPGITAALAAAACAGIPLTQRGISSSVAFCVGHPEDKIRVPRTGTVVYYMAGQNVRFIARKMIASGWPPQTPAAFISQASLPEQKVRISSLAREAKKSRRHHSPMIMIAGETLSVKARLSSLTKSCCCRK
jgi:uroporphyrin-III C-methyltransferase